MKLAIALVVTCFALGNANATSVVLDIVSKRVQEPIISDNSLNALDRKIQNVAPGIKKAQALYKATQNRQIIVEEEDSVVFSFRGELLKGQNADSIAEAKITKPLYSFGRFDKNKQSAMEKTRASQLEIKSAKQDVRIRLIDFYFNWLSTSMRLELYKQQYKILDILLSKIQKRYDLGLLPKTDLASLQLQFANLKRQIFITENDLEISILDLEFLTHSKFTDTSLFSSVSNKWSVLDTALFDEKQILQKDPNSAALTAKIKAKSSEIESIVLSNRPTLNALAVSSVEVIDEGQSINTNAIGISLNYTFSSRDKQNAIKQELLEQKRSLMFELESEQRILETTLKKQLRTINENIKRLVFLEESLKTASSNANSANELFETGSGDWRAYTNAINEVFQLKINIVEDKIDILTASERFKLQLND